jgi:hypothetical protein
MGDFSEEKKLEMRVATNEAAHALSDDIKHLRDVLSKDEISPGDIRRMSNQLRRILVESDLKKVAAPRIGRIVISAPQLKAFHQANEKTPFTLFSGGRLTFQQMYFEDILIAPRKIEIYSKNKYEKVDLTIDQFCAQRVVCFHGVWVTRQDIIKYIANTAHGVHSGDPARDPAYKLIDNLKSHAGIVFENGVPVPEFNIDPAGAKPTHWRFDKDRIDFAMIQLMSTAQYLISSEMIVELERIIDSEA